jgi:hypothetical protein
MALYKLTVEDKKEKISKIGIGVPNVLAFFQCQEDSSEVIKIERINRVSREPMTGIYDE